MCSNILFARPVRSKSYQHFFGYSIGRGKWANVGGFFANPEKKGTVWNGPWVSDCPAQEVVEKFMGWESDLQDIIKVLLHACFGKEILPLTYSYKCMKNPTKWAVHQVKPLPFYTQGRIALVGDAVRGHSMFEPCSLRCLFV